MRNPSKHVLRSTAEAGGEAAWSYGKDETDGGGPSLIQGAARRLDTSIIQQGTVLVHASPALHEGNIVGGVGVTEPQRHCDDKWMNALCTENPNLSDTQKKELRALLRKFSNEQWSASSSVDSSSSSVNDLLGGHVPAGGTRAAGEQQMAPGKPRS
ncbi:unnamed protein product [Lampetra fluviatilis]